MRTYLKLGFGLGLLALGAPLFSGAAMAATETGTLTVSATADGACSVGDGTLDFGSFQTIAVGAGGAQGGASDIDASIGVPVVCTNGTTGAITADDGMNVDTAVRRLRKGVTTDYIKYALYSDSARTTAMTSSEGISVTGDGTDQTATVYGRIAAADLTNQPTGSYSDTVTMTITYTP